MFIEKENRGSNILRIKIMQLNFSDLKNKFPTQIRAVVLELENKELAFFGEKTNYFTDRGYIFFFGKCKKFTTKEYFLND